MIPVVKHGDNEMIIQGLKLYKINLFIMPKISHKLSSDLMKFTGKSHFYVGQYNPPTKYYYTCKTLTQSTKT